MQSKKYQKTHEPYEQLQELVEKNGTKTKSRYSEEEMSTVEKELLKTYEEIFDEENHIMLKSDMYTNHNDRSDDPSTWGCTDRNNTKIATTKGRDKYLKHLKRRCIGRICSCSVASAFLTILGLAKAKYSAAAYFVHQLKDYVSYITIYNMFNPVTLSLSVEAGSSASVVGLSDVVLPTTTAATIQLYFLFLLLFMFLLRQ
ncbi:hypothetical protein PFFVO_00007 [Plasmodium falciparum Vietnam Oak-Knoll (FVO)]|uniref:Surface antigen n=1 Tax=Plasmodium falciparum Vietnam Oak-Knoll (FVO) TaxID=1036723 RepID=A0A024VDU9_PLAFA|nr:hypothetical protein PFFVO_00007 [Plasmodium falciparum Vietnam Oak-Knoll (FVO)]